MGEAVRRDFRSVTGQELECLVWAPEGAPRGVVQLVHGMSEHIARYDATAKRLNEAGWLVVGHTHLGHGEKAETRGYFGPENGWDALIEDVHALRRRTQEEHPALPYFLLGHSMGSFVVRGYCLKHEEGLAGVVLSGTGHFDSLTLNMGLLVSRLQCALGRADKPSRALERMSSSGNNRDWSPERTPFDWLTTDENEVDKYIADPCCGFAFTARGYHDMFGGLKRLLPGRLDGMDKNVPVLLFSGACDPVGGRGEGVKLVAKELRDAGVKDVMTLLYDGGRHEMFNEPQRERVWDDLIRWLNEHLPA